MGVLIAAIVAAAAAMGLGKRDGTFTKGYDTTYKDTVTFEYNAALNTKEHAEAKIERLGTEIASWGPADERNAELNTQPTVDAARKPGI